MLCLFWGEHYSHKVSLGGSHKLFKVAKPSWSVILKVSSIRFVLVWIEKKKRKYKVKRACWYVWRKFHLNWRTAVTGTVTAGMVHGVREKMIRSDTKSIVWYASSAALEYSTCTNTQLLTRWGIATHHHRSHQSTWLSSTACEHLQCLCIVRRIFNTKRDSYLGNEATWYNTTVPISGTKHVVPDTQTTPKQTCTHTQTNTHVRKDRREAGGEVVQTTGRY